MGNYYSLFLMESDEAQDFLRLAELRESSDPDPRNETEASIALLNGRSLIWMNGHDHPGLDDKDMAEISQEMPFLNLDVITDMEYAVCRQWRDGQEEWTVAQDGPDAAGSSTTGTLPPEAAPIITAPGLDRPEQLFEALGGLRPVAPHELDFRAVYWTLEAEETMRILKERRWWHWLRLW